jgi:beta-lactamase regulating signal transducer with metallopeptidase domain
MSVTALGWMLLHFLWQGTLVAAALAVANTLLRAARPGARYAAALSALVVLLALPALTLAVVTAGERTGGGESAGPAAPKPFAAARSAPAADFTSFLAPLTASGSGERPIDALLPWLVAAWALGVAALSVRTLGGWALVWRLRRSARPLPELQERLQDLARRMGLTRAVRACESALVEVPTALGWLRPLVLLPPATLMGLSAAQLELVLAHELAHIRRLDHVAALLQALAETVLFYHPAVWWVSQRLRALREECCDDDAVAAGGDAVAYARTLAALEELRLSAPRPLMALSGGSLAERVRRLVGATPLPAPALSRWPIGMVLLLMAGLALAAPAVAPRVVTARKAERVRPLPGVRPVVVTARHVRAVMAVQARTVARTAAAVFALAVPALPPDPPEVPEVAEPPEPPPMAPRAVEAVMALPVLAPAQPAPPVPPAPPSAPVLWDDEAEQDGTPLAERFDAAQQREMRRHGVDADFVQGLEDAGYKGLDAPMLIALRNHGVDGDYASQLAEAGVKDLSVTNLILLRSRGVDGDYVAELTHAGAGPFSVVELVTLRSQGVMGEDVAAVSALGKDRLSMASLTALRSHGVDADYVKEMADLGYAKLSAPMLIGLRSHGVDADYVRGMQEAGYRDLSAPTLITLRNHGVDADFVREVEEAGVAHPRPEELVRLRSRGFPGTDCAEKDKHKGEKHKGHGGDKDDDDEENEQ